MSSNPSKQHNDGGDHKEDSADVRFGGGGVLNPPENSTGTPLVAGSQGAAEGNSLASALPLAGRSDPSRSIPPATMQGLAAMPQEHTTAGFPIIPIPVPVPVFAFGTMPPPPGDVDPSTSPDNAMQQAAMFANLVLSQQMAAMYRHQQYVANLQQQTPQTAVAPAVVGGAASLQSPAAAAAAMNTAASLELQPPILDDGGPNDGTPPGKCLSMDRDEDEISTYQCLVRQQIEVFAQSDTTESMQGRNKPVQPGQVGIRCRHCGRKPMYRSRGAILFPTTLLGLYQTAQNMANMHLLQTCRLIPVETRKRLVEARSREKGKKTCKSSYGGGRRYWADTLTVLGVVETPGRGLRFGDTTSRGSMQRSVNTGYEQNDSTTAGKERGE